jgi:hypothetical protein
MGMEIETKTTLRCDLTGQTRKVEGFQVEVRKITTLAATQPSACDPSVVRQWHGFLSPRALEKLLGRIEQGLTPTKAWQRKLAALAGEPTEEDVLEGDDDSVSQPT